MPMSGKLVKEVLDFAPYDLTPHELLVLVSLAESARDADRSARFTTSCEAIADRIRSTPGSVRNALMRLRKRGLIVPLHEKCRRGMAQQYAISPLHEGTRKATW